jgi:hypothetical protein
MKWNIWRGGKELWRRETGVEIEMDGAKPAALMPRPAGWWGPKLRMQLRRLNWSILNSRHDRIRVDVSSQLYQSAKATPSRIDYLRLGVLFSSTVSTSI